MNKPPRTAKNYFVGNPKPPLKRGQDSHRMIHCIVWLIIYHKKAFADTKNRYKLGVGGGIIGSARTISEGRKKLHAYAIENIKLKIRGAEDLIYRCNKALEQLGDDPTNLEQFIGEYKEA